MWALAPGEQRHLLLVTSVIQVLIVSQWKRWVTFEQTPRGRSADVDTEKPMLCVFGQMTTSVSKFQLSDKILTLKLAFVTLP